MRHRSEVIRLRLSRRELLAGSAAAALWATAGGSLALGCGKLPRGAPARRAVYLVPGYRSDLARYRGRPANEAPALRRHLPAGHEGPVTMVTRLDERDGGVRRMLLPVHGHAISVHPDGRSAFWSSLNRETQLTFDTASLEPVRLAGPHDPDFMGGGHAAYTPDGRTLLVVERRRFRDFTGRPADHFGRITIRDADSLQVLEVHDTHGINPHEVALLEDGTTVAVSNYGNTRYPAAGRPYRLHEPSLTLVDLASGRLLHKWVDRERGVEVRHLAARRPDRIMAIRVHLVPEGDPLEVLAEADRVYEPDLTAPEGFRYAPASLQRYDGSRPGVRPEPVEGAADPDLRQGQHVVYDAAHDEMIATFPTSHAVLVVGGADGRVRRILRTDRLGLRYPRGLVLHPDGIHYAVAGSWGTLMLFRRGEHRPVPERTLHTLFFDHSHMAVA